ncbi:hypothetical protein [Fusobacterium hwasookii]|jgi:hypothetical protein|uniref:Uncharacterized protein n=1 Tax=Fusobacterium hwasookii ChDC F128 TaxID=1216362 RepID=A0ABP2R6T6_9FUSO|nr:hypothetical protein [Fusobacterium hwasookii]EJU08655.1 hypothetical protein B437_00955 [Fusobacterium hwasookii ChDC F128]
MKRKLFFVLSLFLICSIYIFGEDFPTKAKTVDDFVPKGWKEILTTNGDLNKDKLEDTVIVIEKDDVLGPDYLNLNSRILLVLFKQKDGTYILASKNDKGFIQSENDEENPTLMDTLTGISIKNNTLRINFDYFLSAGSYSASQTIFTFRFQNNRFELIGLDNNSFMRNSGEQEEFSINFSTNKMKTTSGRNMFDEELSKPKETWENINIKKKYILDEMSKDTLDVILDYVY